MFPGAEACARRGARLLWLRRHAAACGGGVWCGAMTASYNNDHLFLRRVVAASKQATATPERTFSRKILSSIGWFGRNLAILGRSRVDRVLPKAGLLRRCCLKALPSKQARHLPALQCKPTTKANDDYWACQKLHRDDSFWDQKSAQKRPRRSTDWLLMKTSPHANTYILGYFIYILDSSNSSSITFRTGQFGSSLRSNWTGIWTGSSNGSWTDKQSSHFSTTKEMSVKAIFHFQVKTTTNRFWKDAEMLLKYFWASPLQTMTWLEPLF